VRLTLEVGPQAVVRTAHRLGIASKLAPNASIALGTSEVSVMELVSAYVPFANGGIAVAPHVIDKVRTAGGKLIYRARNPGLGRVIDERIAAMMNQMMQETLASGTARKADISGFPAAGKTGTSQDFRDAWFVGYTGHLVTGVWLGNDDNSPTKKLTGSGMPVDIWSRFMKSAHQGLPMADLPGMAGRSIDPAQPQAAPQAPAPNPLTSMLAPPHNAAPLSRDDDARPIIIAPRPAVVLVQPPSPAPRAPAPRPPQIGATPLKQQPAPPTRSVQPPSRLTAAPLPLGSAPQSHAPSQPQYTPPQRMAAAPTSTSGIPRPPGAVGGVMLDVRQTSNTNSGVGNFFDNLFGRR